MKIMTVVGTRPELIKLCLVLKKLDQYTDHILVHTGQNYDYELNEIFFKDLNIRKPDCFLNTAADSVMGSVANVLTKVDEALEKYQPDAMLIYGDTNSCLSALAAKRRKIPIFHMEAGNRCFDQRVPEEINRKIIDHLSDINMTITEHARRYLINEGLPPQQVIKVGTSMLEVLNTFKEQINSSKILDTLKLTKNNYFIVSSHREENVDSAERLSQLMQSLNSLAKTYKKEIIFSVHPRTQKKLDQLNLKLDPLIQLMKPLGFHDYIQLQKNSFVVISDSGTLTEESALLGFPGIMIRQAHERPEGMDNGICLMSELNEKALTLAVKVADQQRTPQGSSPTVPDYDSPKVSNTVLKIIISYIDYINREVWKKTGS